MTSLFPNKPFRASFKSLMIWTIANKEIVELLTAMDPTRIQQLSFEIIKLTNVSWFETIKAISEIEAEYSRRWN